ncbi:4-hydroxy-tetrahydrodipicolinate synthase [Rhizobiales bacterium GAS188]|nr:4-hydroxy-tetrahydrodipicolinate synthase [Rhizobiales bacterium GAS188]
MPQLTTDASGVHVIAPTPFDETGALDLVSTAKMVDRYLAAGATGLTILGIMGEAPKLTAAESRLFVKEVLARVGGRVAVTVGVSSPGFAAMSDLTKAVMDMGASGVMIAPTPALRTDDQIVSYFADAAEAIGADVPFVLQDYPQTTNVVMTPKVIARIITANSSCVMLKHEDWPGLDKITSLRRMQAAGELRRVSILVGNGGMFLPYEMERGADGAMTGYAYPEMLVGVVALCRGGKRAEAHDLFDRHLPLVRYETQPGIGLAVRKYVLKRRGFIAHDTQRKPGPKLSTETIADIEWLMARIEAPQAARAQGIAA